MEKIRQSSIHFQERLGKTLDFRVVLGYYGYIVVESGVKNPLCGDKWCTKRSSENEEGEVSLPCLWANTIIRLMQKAD